MTHNMTHDELVMALVDASEMALMVQHLANELAYGIGHNEAVRLSGRRMATISRAIGDITDRLGDQVKPAGLVVR